MELKRRVELLPPDASQQPGQEDHEPPPVRLLPSQRQRQGQYSRLHGSSSFKLAVSMFVSTSSTPWTRIKLSLQHQNIHWIRIRLSSKMPNAPFPLPQNYNCTMCAGFQFFKSSLCQKNYEHCTTRRSPTPMNVYQKVRCFSYSQNFETEPSRHFNYTHYKS